MWVRRSSKVKFTRGVDSAISLTNRHTLTELAMAACEKIEVVLVR